MSAHGELDGDNTDVMGSSGHTSGGAERMGSGLGELDDTDDGGLAVGQHVGKYRLDQLLGRGGMGQVFKAYDTQLERTVALKFLLVERAEGAGRFFREARAQAKVDCPHICKVYEVGEVEERPYIAMQYIAGTTLATARSRMTLEEKLDVMRTVAEAVHEAHKVGLIHRDMKPSNIMVEETEDGQWWGFVLDFGLARELAAPSLTLTGLVLGTPAYMAPEQAEGARDKLDRRTDVYGIGATLYDLLSGRPPYTGAGVAEVLTQVVSRDPTPLRRVDPRIPHDVETIVMTCLEREPGRRYSSARALAEDLTRYLRGETIAARRASLAYRIARQARRHKTLLAVGAVAIAALSATLGLWLRAELQSARRAKLATIFGQDAQQVESLMRYAYLSPIHDLRWDRNAVREKMREVSERMMASGRLAEGPGHYALGRGYLVLGDDEKALEQLRLAWEEGYHEPPVAYAMGLATGRAYQRALEAAGRAPDLESRAALRREAQEKLGRPAAKLLSLAKGHLESPEYVEGLIAYYEHRYDEALTKARQSQSKRVWFYEAAVLEGDVQVAIGRDEAARGNLRQAAQAYDDAGQAYARAIEVGTSDDHTYLAECQRCTALIELNAARGTDPGDALRGTKEAAEKARVIDPSSGEAYAKLADAYAQLAAYQFYHTGTDPRETLREAIQTAEEATRIAPRVGAYRARVGRAYGLIGEYELYHGEDPRPNLTKAIEFLKQGLAQDPDQVGAYGELGAAFTNVGAYELDKGSDPRVSLAEALAVFREAVRRSPADAQPHVAIGLAYWRVAKYEALHDLDPRESLQAAERSYMERLRINPKDAMAMTNMGIARRNTALYEKSHGVDPRKTFDASIDAFESALRHDSTLYPAYLSLGLCHADAGRYLLDQQSDPRQHLDAARRAFEQSLSIRSDLSYPHTGLGQVHLSTARFLALHGQEPEPSMRLAILAYGEALRARPSEVEALQGLAEVWMLKAVLLTGSGASPKAALNNARSALQKAAGIGAESAETYRLLAEVSRCEAEWVDSIAAAGAAAGSRGQRKDEFRRAVEKGLAMVAECLKRSPRSSEAILSQARLYELQARAEPDSTRRAALVALCRDRLAAAKRINSNIAPLSRSLEERLKHAGPPRSPLSSENFADSGRNFAD